MLRGRSSRCHRILVALAALGLILGVRPASFARGRLVLGPALPAIPEPEEILVGSLDIGSESVGSEDDLAVTAAEEDEPVEGADDSVDLTWLDLNLVGRFRREVSTSPSFPAALARPVPARARHPRTLDARPNNLPILLCRLTC